MTGTSTKQDELYKLNKSSILRASANYFNGGADAYGGSFAGFHFENICLQAIPYAGKTHQITFLSSSPSSDDVLFPVRHVTVPRESATLPCDWIESKALRKNVHYLPKSKTFESVDSFFVNDENELFAFQITIAQAHPVKSHGLRTIVSAFTPLDLANCYLIFVVPQYDKEISRCSREVQMFKVNQWRMEYILSAPADAY